MVSRVTYPKRGFIEFKRSTLFPFRKIAIASKKDQPGGKQELSEILSHLLL